jgi:hypothetical protein
VLPTSHQSQVIIPLRSAKQKMHMMAGVMIPFHEDGEAELRRLRQTCRPLVSAVSASGSLLVQ